jgi:hypothetical protein
VVMELLDADLVGVEGDTKTVGCRAHADPRHAGSTMSTATCASSAPTPTSRTPRRAVVSFSSGASFPTLAFLFEKLPALFRAIDVRNVRRAGFRDAAAAMAGVAFNNMLECKICMNT